MARKATRKIGAEITLRNIRTYFLNAVDLVTKKNRENGIKPDSDRSLSEIVGPDEGSINKIRKEGRNPTSLQIANLGNAFNLDFNYIYRGSPGLRYALSDSVFLLEKEEELLIRLQEGFKNEVEIMQNILKLFGEGIRQAENENKNTPLVQRSKILLEEGKQKLLEALQKNG